MITLFQYNYHFNMNCSPFCLKVEIALKLLNIPFVAVTDFTKMNPPKGKLPYIEDNGSIIPDSSFILNYIKEKYGKSLDSELSEYEKAVSVAFKKMIEEHLYWIGLYSRWFDKRNSEIIKKNYFGDLPQEMIYKIYEKTKRDFEGTGIGLHTEEEIYKLGTEDLTAIKYLVESKKGSFIFGDNPSEIDVILYAFLIQILEPKETSSPLQDFIKKESKIINYVSFLEKTWNVK